VSRPFPAVCALPALALLGLLAACEEPTPTGSPEVAPAASAPSGHVVRHYGAPVKVGDGIARTYILINSTDRNTPLELGVALSARAMEGLPGVRGTPEQSMVMNLLALPVKNPTPYQFVELDWNPGGHEPLAIYGVPHFDFHFYTISREVRRSIVPSDSRYAEAAGSFPAEAFRPPFYLDAATAAGLPPALVTVPQMGLHWFDLRSPELQAVLGNPAGFQAFTRTFFKGTWDGRFIFDEPMITRAWLLTKRTSDGEAAPDEIIPVSTAQRYTPAAFYPQGYRIAYDARAREFLVGLTELAWRE
jgi:hypothetical protein